MGNRGRDQPVSLATERLILQPFTKQDGRLLRELFRDPEVTRYLPWGHPYSEAETNQRLQQLLAHWRRHHFGAYTVRTKTGRRPIGYAGLEVVAGTPFVELLYALIRRSWGQGYGSEAAAACLRLGFHSLGLPLIVGVIASGNHGSQRVLEKLGMRPAPEMDFYGGGLLYYSLSRERYAAFRPDRTG